MLDIILIRFYYLSNKSIYLLALFAVFTAAILSYFSEAFVTILSTFKLNF